MQLKLIRKDFTQNSTIGELYLNEIFECFILEDVVRDVKIPGETAIPYGSYRVVIDDSVRFKRRMPHILDVPNFTGVRIHAGNDKDDTHGCLLCGMHTSLDFVGGSRIAFDKLFAKLDKAFNDGENIMLHITKDS